MHLQCHVLFLCCLVCVNIATCVLFWFMFCLLPCLMTGYLSLCYDCSHLFSIFPFIFPIDLSFEECVLTSVLGMPVIMVKNNVHCVQSANMDSGKTIYDSITNRESQKVT